MSDFSHQVSNMNLLALPDDVLEKVFSYMSYDEISHCRLVCQRFNDVSKRMLNHGFHKVEKYLTQCLKRVKSQLPRRESERRNHPLARHCDILTAVETRLSLLGMTFKKFIDMNYCCFIPGKVLDEIYKVLRYVSTEQLPIRAHEVMQELRDLSSMAMEYFDEKIAPGLRKSKDTGPKINILCSSIRHLRPGSSRQFHAPKDSRILIMAQYLSKLVKRHNKLESEVAVLRGKKKEQDNTAKRLNEIEQFVAETKKKLIECEKTMAEQQMTITNQALQISEQELKIEKLKLFEGKPEINCSFDPGSDSSQCAVVANAGKKPTARNVKNASSSLRSSKRKHQQNDESVRKRIKK